MEAIASYPLDVFMMFLHAVDQLEAAGRIALISDLTAVVAGMYSDPKSKEPSALQTHLDALGDVLKGKASHGSES